MQKASAESERHNLLAFGMLGNILSAMGCGMEVESPQLARTCNGQPELLLLFVQMLTAPNFPVDDLLNKKLNLFY
jgi:hypothetical protein